MFQLTLPGGFNIQDPTKFKNETTLGPVLSELLKYIYPVAGLVLFAMLIAGGFGLLTAAGNPEGLKKAQAQITSALIGFVIIFVSYWLVQLLQAIFGLGKIF